jgi:hypothetical protein
MSCGLRRRQHADREWQVLLTDGELGEPRLRGLCKIAITCFSRVPVRRGGPISPDFGKLASLDVHVTCASKKGHDGSQLVDRCPLVIEESIEWKRVQHSVPLSTEMLYFEAAEFEPREIQYKLEAYSTKYIIFSICLGQQSKLKPHVCQLVNVL